jgi:hypothetical protein
MPDLLEALLIVAPPTLLLVEAVRRCPVRRLARAFALQSCKSVRLIASDTISDRGKEKALLAYSGTLLRLSLSLGGWVALLLGGFALALHLSGRAWNPGFDTAGALMAADYLLLAVVVAAAALSARRLLGRA